MAENQALEGMTQEEFNTFLDGLDKSYIDANGGIDVIKQRALTGHGRETIKEELKAFKENAGKQQEPEQKSPTPEAKQQGGTASTGQTQGEKQQEGTTQTEQTQVGAPTPEPKNQEEVAQPTIDPKQAEQEKLASDFKKLYGVDYTSENFDRLNKEGKLEEYKLTKVAEILSDKGASKALKGRSTEDLAKMQLTVRMAEFASKYNVDEGTLPGFAGGTADTYKKISENKDKMNDAILDKMERYASGDKKIKGGDYKSWKAEKDSFNMLYENQPEELKKHCSSTFEKANKRVNPRGAYSSDKLAHATAQKLKYKSMEIKDTDSLWTMAKKTAKMKAFTASRSAKKSIRNWWKEGKVGKFARGLVDNKLTRGVSRLSSKVANKIKLFPSRAKKAIGKFWTNKIAGPMKRFWETKIADPFKNKIVTPVKNFVNNKIVQPVKNGVNNYIVQPVKNGVKWVKENPKKAIAAATMVATTGIGFALAGPAGGLAGAKIGAMAVGGAALGYGTVKAGQWTGKKIVEVSKKASEKITEVKTQTTENLKTNLKESFEKSGEKFPKPYNKEETEEQNLAYTTGRQVFNENSEQAQKFVGAYKKMITPDGNTGTPQMDEKAAAVMLYQAMLTDRSKNGMGLNEKQADAMMAYFNGNGTVKSELKDIKAEIAKDKINEQATGKPKEEINEEWKQKEQEAAQRQTDKENLVKKEQEEFTGQDLKAKSKDPRKDLPEEKREKLDKMIAGYQVFIASAGGKDKEPAQAKKIEKWLTSEKGLGLEKEQAEKLMDFYGKKGKVASWHPKARQEAQNKEAQEAARTQRQSDKATKRILDSKANVND